MKPRTKKITLQFVTTSGWESHLIRFATWSEFSHVDFVLNDGRLLGAHYNGGVAIREPNYERFTRVARYEVRGFTNEQCHAMRTFLYAQIGKPYDWQAILGFGIRRDWHNPDAWMCSEYAEATLEIGGRPAQNKPRNRVTPQNEVESPIMHKMWEYAL